MSDQHLQGDLDGLDNYEIKRVKKIYADEIYQDDNQVIDSDSTINDLSDVDDYSITDAGKVLKVNSTGDSTEWAVDESGTDEKVKYDSSDPTAGYVSDKFIAGTGVSVAEGTGGDENKLVISSNDSEINHNGLNNYSADEHRTINDSGTLTTDLFSANKINTELGKRSEVSTGTTAPSSTPSKVGDIYIDTTLSRFYIAVGTSSSADWRGVLIQ